MVSENASSKVLERKMESGLFLTEAGEKLLIVDRDYKPMDTILSIY
jgi:hypothetical protein